MFKKVPSFTCEKTLMCLYSLCYLSSLTVLKIVLYVSVAVSWLTSYSLTLERKHR